MSALTVPSTLTAVLLCGLTGHAAEKSVAVFDFELVDTSLEGATNGPRIDEQDRIFWLGENLRKRLSDTGRFEIITVPADVRSRAGKLQNCNGCEIKLARELGAKLAITGWVQKVSNLILNLNVAVLDADSGLVVASASVDMRGNTQESWARALDYIVRNRLLAPGGL